MSSKSFDELPAQLSGGDEVEPILQWLARGPSTTPQDDTVPLLTHLKVLLEKEIRIPTTQRAKILDLLYPRYVEIKKQLLPALSRAERPISRSTRRLARNLQDIQRALAEAYSSVLRDQALLLIPAIPQSGATSQRVLSLLSQHLLTSYLTAAPARYGIWQMVHETYHHALDVKEGFSDNLTRQYLMTLALACIQPAAFTAGEVNIAYKLIEQGGQLVSAINELKPEIPGLFWVEPDADTPPQPFNNRTPSRSKGLFYFSTAALGQWAKQRYEQLKAGENPGDLSVLFNDEKSVDCLRRIAGQWINPTKRRFQRRHQSYRAQLCIGFTSIWNLFTCGPDSLAANELSGWMIINEGPEGCAAMHINGKISGLDVGSIAAIRTEAVDDWQICIVRWQLSENPEHLELGLQLLAPHAIAVYIGIPARQKEPFPALLLPPTPALKMTQTLMVRSGNIDARGGEFVCVIEKNNLEIREYREISLAGHYHEIDLLAVEQIGAT